MTFCQNNGMLSIGVVLPDIKSSTVTTGMVSRPYCAIEPVKVLQPSGERPARDHVNQPPVLWAEDDQSRARSVYIPAIIRGVALVAGLRKPLVRHLDLAGRRLRDAQARP